MSRSKKEILAALQLVRDEELELEALSNFGNDHWCHVRVRMSSGGSVVYDLRAETLAFAFAGRRNTMYAEAATRERAIEKIREAHPFAVAKIKKREARR